MHRLLATTSLTALLATPALSDTVLATDNGIINDSLCVGFSCANPETFWSDSEIVIKDVNTRLRFDDNSDSASSFPDTDWTLQANDTISNGADQFMLMDATAGTTPLAVSGGAPTNSVFVAADGKIGMGTSMPQAALQISKSSSADLAQIRLENTATSQSVEVGMDFNGGFYVHDPDIISYPFYIANDAPSDSFNIDSDGNIGLGTTSPQADMHLVSGSVTFRLEQTSFNPIAWDQYIDPTGHFYIYNTTALTTPFTIAPTAPDSGLFLGPTGTGIGTVDPQSRLHVKSDAGDAKLLVEETTATSKPRTLLNLQNNGRPEIVMGNSAKASEWSLGAGGSFFLKTGALGSASNAKTKVFTVKGNGDAILAGTLTTGGTTCSGGCDRVFTEDYDLPSITEHRDRMMALGHLPNVGPTIEGAPINVSTKLGGILNELEHAHLYIAELETRLSDQQARIEHLTQQPSDDRIATLEARLEALAAELSQLR